jgi:putative transposase
MNKSYPRGQRIAALLPAIELIERSRDISEGLLLEIGKLTLETLLGMSAVQVAGEPSRGKPKGEIRHHGSQLGRVVIGGRRIQVERPRLRSKAGREVLIPAYEALKSDPKSAERTLSRVLAGVSTRDYKGIFDVAGKELGLSKSNVSRQAVKSAEEALRELAERKITTRQLAILVDGVRLGASVIACAIGIDEVGAKRVLGLSEGATENAAAVGALMDSIIERGLDPKLPILFIIDGSKALRKAVSDRFQGAVVQRCRVHKIRNVLDHLPKTKRRYVRAKLAMAYRLPYVQALDRLEELARELEVCNPGAAASLREGLHETLTITRLNLTPRLIFSLGSTNLIESSFGQAKCKLRRFNNFSSGAMSMRWCAATLRLAESHFRTLMGHRDLWMLQAVLDRPLELQVK